MDGAAVVSAAQDKPQALPGNEAVAAAAPPPSVPQHPANGIVKQAAVADGCSFERHGSGKLDPAASHRHSKSSSHSHSGSMEWRTRSGECPGRSRSKSRARSSSKERQRHRKHSRSKIRSRSHSRERRLHRSKSGASRSSRSRSRSCGRSVDSEGERHKHKHHRHHHHHRHRDKQHLHHHHYPHDKQLHRKRSRSRSAPPAVALIGEQRQPSGPFAAAAAAAAAKEPLQEPGSATAAPGRAAGAAEDGEMLRRDSSVGASSLVKLSLRPPAMQPSPSTAAAARALLRPPTASGCIGGASPMGLPGLTPLHTPSAAALAAAQGIDISDMPLVQPSPMAAEATVAALSALIAQPARHPSMPHPKPSLLLLHHHHKRGPAAAGGSASEKKKQLLSFGDELEEDEGEGNVGGGGMSAATAKRFKHEKTLVMLNPSLSGDLQAHPLASLEDEDLSLPCSPAAPLDKRLGQMLWGSAQAKGMRPYMEDRHTIINSYQPRTSTGQQVQDGVFRAYAAVFDGHNGASAAEHASARLHHVLAQESALRTCTGEGPPATALQEEERVAAALVHSFEAVDREIMTRCRLESTKGGATGLVLLRMGNQLYAAHCGDSRAVMSRNNEALRLTEDHKPNLPRERKRVEALGGRVDFARCWRVIVDPGDGRPASGLAVSRSFGDPDFKEPLHLVTATPDVIRERLLPGDDFVILASDGLWDVLTDSDACNVVRQHLQQSGAPRQITPPQLLLGAAAFGGGSFADQLRRPLVLTAALAMAAAKRLVQESLDRGTMDNVTAVVGLLQWA